jgi:hypothetical protein
LGVGACCPQALNSGPPDIASAAAINEKKLNQHFFKVPSQFLNQGPEFEVFKGVRHALQVLRL